jgi:23S rRNA (adenine2503-C2)-methyltransferase
MSDSLLGMELTEIREDPPVSALPAALRQELGGPRRAGLPEIAQRNVLMPEDERDTICISSQVGCPVDCKFCMTR